MNYNHRRPVHVQDTVHIATKLKTRMLNPKVEMKMGSYKVSSAHVQFIIQNHSKDKHLLSENYLKCKKLSNYYTVLY